MKWPLAPPFINKLNTISAHASRNMINRCYHKEWAGVLVGMGWKSIWHNDIVAHKQTIWITTCNDDKHRNEIANFEL